MRKTAMTSVISRIEPLEARYLYSAFEANINFQPAKLAVPDGYVADTGAVFGDRGNGLTYGWNGKVPAVVAHQAARAPNDGADARYDTFALLNPRGRGSVWQIVVPDGDYDVHVVVGNPLLFPVHYQVLAEGTVILDGRAVRHQQWVDATGQVAVADGMLTLTAPRGIIDRLDFIDIVQVVPSSPSPPASPPSPPPPPAAWITPLSWQTLAPAPEALAEAMSVAVGDKLYVFGGYNVDSPNYLATTHAEVYDSTTNSWTALADVPEPLTHASITSDGTYIYLAGGYLTDLTTSYQTFGITDTWRYDIATNSWSAFVPLPAPRAAGSMVLLGDELHFFDGVDPTRTGQTEHWVLNLGDASPQWIDSTPLPLTRNHMDGVVLDGKIYAIGGQPTDDDSITSSDVLLWDPANPGSWTPVASLPMPMSHAVAGVIDGRIIIAGGTTTNDVPLDEVMTYDPTTNTWTTQTALPAARLAAVGGIVGNEFIVTTGYDYPPGLNTTTWAATIQ